MQLQRMPADGSGKVHYCQPGGLMAAMAEDAEECVLQVALQDVDRATALMRQERVTRAELVQVLCYLIQSTKAAVDVAECRGERLPAQAGDDTEADTSD